MISSLFYNLLIVLSLGMSLECLASQSAVKEVSQVSSKWVDKEGLIALVAASKNDTARQIAKMILNDCYETKPRPIIDEPGKKQFGFAFCVEPEVLAHLMKMCRGKTVLEIGAARGESALLMSLAGAKKVYINDISPMELTVPQFFVSELGLAVELLPGNCLEVCKESRFAGCFDVIYARNLFTFFVGEERERFVQEMLRLLKPGGCLYLTVNSALNGSALNGGDELKRAYLACPEAYVFKKRTPFTLSNTLDCIGEGSMSPELNLKGIDVTANNAVPLMKFTEHGPKYEEEFEQFTPDAKKELQKYVTEQIESKGLELLSKTSMPIVCHITHMAAYTGESLKAAFSDNDWDIVQEILLGDKFHIKRAEEGETRLTMIVQKKQSAQLETSAVQTTKVSIAKNTTCSHCGISAQKIMRCGTCKRALYCSTACQRADWAKGHKSVCKPAQVNDAKAKVIKEGSL